MSTRIEDHFKKAAEFYNRYNEDNRTVKDTFMTNEVIQARIQEYEESLEVKSKNLRKANLNVFHQLNRMEDSYLKTLVK